MKPHNAGPGVLGEPPVDHCLKVLDDGELCGVDLPEGHHPTQRYCEEHSPAAKKRARRDKAPSDVKAPRNVNVKLNLGSGKAPGKAENKDAKLVAEGAERMLGLVAIGFMVAGDETCGTALQNQIPLIAKQIGELATYHPGLKKIFAPMETTGESMVWIGLVVAVAPVIISILVHHQLVKPDLAEKLAVIASVGGAMTVPVADAA